MWTAPVVTAPDTAIFAAIADLATPALVYDLDGLRDSIARMQADVSLIPGARLNFALKACHTGPVIRAIAAMGVGADVASSREHDVALAAGFSEISATGPSFRDAGVIERMRRRGTVLDVDSLDQARFLAATAPGSDVGLRLRVPIPARIDTVNAFGVASRFGVDATSPAVQAALGNNRVVRLHLHAGQMTPAMFLHHLRYTLAVTDLYTAVELIDFGGGFYDFYADRSVTRAALLAGADIVAAHRRRSGRAISFRFEPGAAVVGPHGFLALRVESVEERHPAFGVDVVQVNASAWNLAPWHKPRVLSADGSSAHLERRLVAGNTLYEYDFFGMSPNGGLPVLDVPRVAVGDRVVLTGAGAYTMTNRRDFNLLGRVSEYTFESKTVRPVVDGASV